jgi:anti-sigma factor RsiW
MTHLTDEQFEDVLAGRAAEPPHMATCADCRNRLAEHRALAARVRSSFASVRPSEALAERIRRSLEGARPAAAPVSPARSARTLRLWRPIWAVLTAAAAVLVLAIPLTIYLTTPSAAVAAQQELVRIHTGNLAGHHDLYADADPAHLADYLKTQLGFEPATPRLGQGMAMRGCCVAHFKGQAVGSYVVDTPRGPISIIVLPQSPADLGMKDSFEVSGETFWKGGFATNNMVVARGGDYSYCAVGEVPHEILTQILENLGLSR